jgi:sugar lactone lactonase YvrE
MMKYLSLLIFSFISCGILAQDKASLLFKSDEFSHPESAVIDEQGEFIYVSNIGEKEPGDGFISKLNRKGEILELRWIEGLEDPKGLWLHGNKLYVSDNTQLVEMDIEKATITRKIEAKNSGMLNDIVGDEEGNLYISDTRANVIFQLKKGDKKLTELIRDEKLDSPNGLWLKDDLILVASWGEDKQGKLLQLNPEGEISEYSKNSLGNLDGIQEMEDGSYLVSAWDSGNIYKIGADGEEKLILTSDRSAGDILFLQEEKILILPMNLQNSLWWYQLK